MDKKSLFGGASYSDKGAVSCIWIGIVKLSLWRTRYFSSADNVLTSSRKIWHVNKRNFFEHNFVASHKWIWWRCCDADFNSAWARLWCCLSKHPLKREFLDIYLTTFSESVTSKIQNLWGLSFYSKCSKFNLDFKNAAQNLEKIFCFWDNCIWHLNWYRYIVPIKNKILFIGSQCVKKESQHWACQ